MRPHLIALVGDYSPDVLAHSAIPTALDRARADAKVDVAFTWIRTAAVREPARDLGEFAGVWLVPASPYESMEGALAAVRFARETGRPFLGTCGGFQHALIEVARDVAGLPSADHAETAPESDVPLIRPLACSLVEKTGIVHFAPDSALRRIYGREWAHEGYHCSYGVNASYRTALERAGLRFTAFDEHGELRAAELPAPIHPFFIGTLFQPERAALRGETPPVVRAFVAAVARAK